MLQKGYRKRIHYTEADKALMWERRTVPQQLRFDPIYSGSRSISTSTSLRRRKAGVEGGVY